MQKLAEKVLPESQCGFRKRRSCIDIIYMVRQLAEKVIEYVQKKYFIFVDLIKHTILSHKKTMEDLVEGWGYPRS